MLALLQYMIMAAGTSFTEVFAGGIQLERFQLILFLSSLKTEDKNKY